MIRIILTYLLPLALPTAAYFLWLRLRRRSAAAAGGGAGDGGRRPAVPWVWLGLAGLALLATTLFTLALTGGGQPGETYVPAYMEDGRLVPGRSTE